MNIVGTWKLYRMMSRDDELNIVWKTKDEMLASLEPGDDMAMILNSLTVFNEDGTVLSVAPIPDNVPKEMIDAAVAAGEVKLYGGNMFILEQKAWKEEDGKLMFDTGVKGEVFGEAVSTWVEIIELEGGVIELPMRRLIRE